MLGGAFLFFYKKSCFSCNLFCFFATYHTREVHLLNAFPLTFHLRRVIIASNAINTLYIKNRSRKVKEQNTSPNGEKSELQKEQIKHEKRPSTVKARLLPSILLAIVAPLCVCGTTPFEIFGGNLSEFKFVLADFWPLCLLIALIAAAFIFTVLIICEGRVYDTVYGLIFGISLMLFLQSNYLSLSQTSLEGDGTGEGLPIWQIVLNTALWVIIPAASIAAMLCLKKFKDTVRLIVAMMTAIMIFMSLVSFLTVSMTTDVFSDGETDPAEESLEQSSDQGTEKGPDSEVGSETAGEASDSTSSEDESETESGSAGSAEDENVVRMLTVENLNTLAKKENIIVFIVDRFDQRHYKTALSDCPEVLEELDGFTYFNDYITLYPRTFPAIPHLMTGIETDFSLSRLDYFDKAYKTSPILHSLKDAGFDINLYTDTYYGYENASSMASYATNISGKAEYTIVNKQSLSLDMLRLSLYRSLPTCLRSTVGDIRTTTFDKYVEYKTESDVYTTDMRDVYNTLTAQDFTLRDSDKGYSFIHISGCHLPNLYDENFEPVAEEDKWNSVFAIKQSFAIINEYISEMKRLGVYEDATIIITGDHASIGSDTKDPYYAHMTTLLVKPRGVSEGSFTSSAQISTDNIFATILDAADISVDGFDADSVFEVSEDETRTRRYLFQRTGSSDHEMIEYEIVGDGNVFSNWKIKNRYFIGKRIYE